MLTTKEVEFLEKSAVKVKITVPEAEIKKEYDELVKNYCKTLQIKGFRKGKIPPNILIRKFGDALKDETTQKVMEKSLEEVLESIEQKPLPYCRPSLVDEEDIKLDLDKDFSYAITYDCYPKVELGKYKDLEVEEPQVNISEKDLAAELKTLQEQNAMVVEKFSGIVAKDDIITIDYVELDDEGKEKEDTRRESFTFTVGTGYNLYEFDDLLIAMKKDEEKIIEKEFPADYRYESLAGKKVKLKVKVTNIKVKDIPELDDELAQDISDKYQTLDDLKNDLRQKLKDNSANKVREDKIAQLIEKIAKSSTIDLPESMVQQEMEMRWRTMLYRFGANEQMLLKELENQEKTRDSLLNEWRPQIEEGLKSQIVVEELKKLENITVSPEEIDAEIQKMADAKDISLEEMKKNLQANRMIESVNINIHDQKLFTHLLKSTKIKKGKKIKYQDYMNPDKQED